MTASVADDGRTRLDMFELGWFGQGAAFWRWIETPEAVPYIRACAAMRAPPSAGELALAPFDGDELLDPDALDELAARIEREHGGADLA